MSGIDLWRNPTERPARASGRGARSRPVRSLLPLLSWILLSMVLGCEPLGKARCSQLFVRSGWQLPEEVVAALDIAPGDQVVDLGAGDGYFVPYLAEAVGPSGTVYAVEVDEEKVRDLRDRAEREGWANVRVVSGRTDDPQLPDGEMDLVLLVNVYHHIDDRVGYFRRLHADLRPRRGRVATIDMREEGIGSWVTPDGHWTELEVLRREMGEAGYQHTASFDFLPVQTLEVFSPVGSG